MEEILYSKEHYWVEIDNDIATIGMTPALIDYLGNISYIELNSIGSICNKTDIIGTIYSDSEEIHINSLFTGEIVETNDLILEEAENISATSKEYNWLYKIFLNNKNEAEDLITEEEYDDFVEKNL